MRGSGADLNGHSINPLKWDSDKQRAKQGSSNARGITYNVINSHLASIERDASSFENRCRVEQPPVTKKLIKGNVKTSDNKNAGARSIAEEKRYTVLECFDMFVTECGKKERLDYLDLHEIRIGSQSYRRVQKGSDV